ncbi:MAG: hypothetical protein ACM3XM_13980 [Mycobacterium leprae]
MFDYQYRRLGSFTYHVLENPSEIAELFARWILPEMQTDHSEDPSQQWTVEWLEQAPHLTYTLQAIPLSVIRPRADLMAFETEQYSFRRSLERRADEREQAFLRGVSAEPLWVKREGWELMDGYTRFTVFTRHRQELVYAYVGEVEGARA